MAGARAGEKGGHMISPAHLLVPACSSLSTGSAALGHPGASAPVAPSPQSFHRWHLFGAVPVNVEARPRQAEAALGVETGLG